MTIPNLPKLLQPTIKALEKDLLTRTKAECVEAGLKTAWSEEQKAGETGLGFDPWRRERVTQLAVAWILSVVFVRTLEDRGYIDPKIAGADSDTLHAAEDREALFLQIAPFLGPREYLLAVFRELAKLPGARDVFDTKHNPVWVLSPSSEGAKALLDFFRKRDETGNPALIFTGNDTRFLGDLYQNLSEAVRKRYALLQTPEFVEEFILDQTLDPAIAEFGLKEVTLIDPTCGSGHFLLGAFRRLLGRWQKEAPTETVAELARRALDQVYGVDINPYAVAIARFRLVLALLDAVGIHRLEKAPDIRPNVVVADSLLHRFGERANAQMRLSEQIDMDDIAWGDQLFRLEDRSAVERVLSKRFHAVVGNPPYITEKDPAKRKAYREHYKSAAGLFTLAAPFAERFFGLAMTNGFVGLINSNAWAKRDYGKALVDLVLSRHDIQRIIDTAGCYLPGHGTPTLLLFGRNCPPSNVPVAAVLGKRGEAVVPENPAMAPVWSEITQHYDEVGFESASLSVESIERREVNRHPWILAGGGARTAFKRISAWCNQDLASLAETIGFMCMTKQDEAFVAQSGVLRRHGVTDEFIRPFYKGQNVGDWEFKARNEALFPYDSSVVLRELDTAALRFLFPSKTALQSRKVFGGKNYREAGRPWWGYGQIPVERSRRARSISFAFVETHNNFVMYRGGAVLNQHAPIVTLKAEFSEEQHHALLGYLNSSTVGFCCRLVMFPKGGDQVGDGARLSASQWNRHLEYAGNLLQQLPVPRLEDLRTKLLDLVVAAEETVRKIAEQGPDKVVAATLSSTPTLAALRATRTQSLAERARLRGILVSLQEEMDWRVYGIFGLPTVEAPSLDSVRVPVEPNHRPFEVRLAREVATDIAASEWFRVHKREAPKDVGGPLADLYRQRLRLLDDPEHGKQLRLLETPETKRRWSPPDDAKAFVEAVRTWLLERIEAWFRDQLVPELRTARQIALELGKVSRLNAQNAGENQLFLLERSHSSALSVPFSQGGVLSMHPELREAFERGRADGRQAQAGKLVRVFPTENPYEAAEDATLDQEMAYWDGWDQGAREAVLSQLAGQDREIAAAVLMQFAWRDRPEAKAIMRALDGLTLISAASVKS